MRSTEELEDLLLKELKFIYGDEVKYSNMYTYLLKLLQIDKVSFRKRFKRLRNDDSTTKIKSEVKYRKLDDILQTSEIIKR